MKPTNLDLTIYPFECGGTTEVFVKLKRVIETIDKRYIEKTLIQDKIKELEREGQDELREAITQLNSLLGDKED